MEPQCLVSQSPTCIPSAITLSGLSCFSYGSLQSFHWSSLAGRGNLLPRCYHDLPKLHSEKPVIYLKPFKNSLCPS